MKQFMDKDFVLETETAKHLYHDYAARMPLVENGEYPNIDASLKRIVEGIRYNNAARYFGL